MVSTLIPTQGDVGGAVALAFIFIGVAIMIFMTEKRLKKNFDKKGNRLKYIEVL